MRKSVRLLKIVLPVVALAIGVGVMMALAATKPELPARELEERVWTVDTAEVRITDERPDLVVYGTVRAGREVELRPLVEGRVIETGAGFDDGERVAKGDLLIAIDPFEYDLAVREAHADLLEAQARGDEIAADIEVNRAVLARVREQVGFRDRDVERFRKLEGRGVASGASLDEARLALSQTQMTVDERQATVAKLAAQRDRQKAVIERAEAAVSRAERDLAETRLTAPFAGYLVDVGIDVGKRVSRSDRVARLIDSERLEVSAHLSNAEYGRLVQAGSLQDLEAEVVWDASTPPLVFEARIDRVEGEIDAASGGVDVYAVLTGGDLSVIRPGAFVAVHVPDRTYRDVVRLPETAFHEEGTEKGGEAGTVYVIEDGRLAPRRAALVARIGDDVLLEGDLAPGDRAVRTLIPEIRAGLRAETVDGRTDNLAVDASAADGSAAGRR